jgi:signal transduction histidine kinase
MSPHHASRGAPAVELSEFIEAHRGAIVAAWAAKVRGELLRTALRPEQLHDALHLFLDEVVEALERSSETRIEAGHSAVARAHGRQRQTVRLHIGEVVREYGLLFETIVGLASEAGTLLRPSDLLALSRHLYTGAAEAVDEFAEKSQAERRHADFEAFAFLAHEIRNPLSTAKLTWQLLQHQEKLHGAAAERHARSLERLSALVDHSLTHSRLAMVGDGAPLHREPIALDELLQGAAEDSAAEAEHKRIQIEVDAPSDTCVAADSRLLRSAITNLVRNAVKFTRRQGLVLLRARVDAARASIEIKDQCGGLPPDRAERLFESFIQAGSERSGFGLGLAIVRQAVEAHGGTIEVKNHAGHGCLFAIELPLEPPAASRPRAPVPHGH